jgi:UV DNA damage endonuclease
MFPCYTLDFTREWYLEIWDIISNILERAGEQAKRHEVRLSVHPGQFTVLGSNDAGVVENSIKDLEYHALYGKLMNIPAKDFVMNIHLQGLYGGKHEDGIKRFTTNFHYLSDYAQQCLAVENEDKPNGYDIAHTIELAQRIPTRCTLDTHHYACHRMTDTVKVKLGEKTVNRKVRDVQHITHTSDYFKEAVKTWKDVRPLFHKSQSFHPDNQDYWMKPNAHSEMFWDEELMANHVPMLQYADFDIEAKNKEAAVHGFYSFIKQEEQYAGESLKTMKLT